MRKFLLINDDACKLADEIEQEEESYGYRFLNNDNERFFKFCIEIELNR